MEQQKQFVLILPNVRSCHNVGSMFRTADAFGVTKIYLVGYTACPPKPQIDKVSLGAEKWMQWEHRKDLAKLVKKLRRQGFNIIGLEKSNSSSDIKKAKFEFPLALIVGNEVDGLDEKTIKLCDQVVHIPMKGKKESLNVSVAAGIALYIVGKGI
jgi:tRNA G18 (ribose-2'-O)-methylase SpoU